MKFLNNHQIKNMGCISSRQTLKLRFGLAQARPGQLESFYVVFFHVITWWGRGDVPPL